MKNIKTPKLGPSREVLGGKWLPTTYIHGIMTLHICINKINLPRCGTFEGKDKDFNFFPINELLVPRNKGT